MDKIEELEFEYAKETAAQAIRDRYTMLNFLITVVAVITGALGFSGSRDSALISAIFIYFVSLLFGFITIRLRSAWHNSLIAMNQIKEKHINITNKDAFIWRLKTVPKANKLWSASHLNYLLIAFINMSSLSTVVQLLLNNLFLSVVIAILYLLVLNYVYFKLLS